MTRYRVALVTGASSGIGRSLAVALAARGAGTVVLIARRQAELEQAAREVRAAGARAIVEPLDVSDTELTVRRLRALDEQLGGLDLVVANAGAGAASGADPLAWETLREPFHLNFCGAAATLTAALGGMRERGRGHLVGIGSISAYGALPGSAAYCTPKAGLAMLLDCLRLDLLGTGIDVTHVRLGFVRTAMVAHSTHPMPQLLAPDRVASQIAGRLPAGPREIVAPRALAAAARLAAAAPGPLRELVARAARSVL